MKKFALTCSLVALVALAFNVKSEAQSRIDPSSTSTLNATAVNLTLHDGNLSYIVPLGQVLVIEHLLWALEGDATHQSVRIVPESDVPGVGDFLLKFSTTAPDMHTFERPLRIVGDGASGVRILNNGAADWRDVAIIGFLKDA